MEFTSLQLDISQVSVVIFHILQAIAWWQEPMSRSMELNYISVSAFSYTDLFLDLIYFEWDSCESAITNHKTLIDVTASLDRNCLSFTNEKVY